VLTKLAAKPKGIPISDVSGICARACRPLETKLARQGLRPTADEKDRAARRPLLPLIALLGLGGLKLIIGLSLGKPVAFLVFLLFGTFFVIVFLASSMNSQRLTRAGMALLGRLRMDQATQSRQSGFNPDFTLWSTGVALAGTYAMIGLADQALIAASLDQNLGRRAAAGSGEGGSSGCSASGCGSSGCGSSCGGGCGGCGGGGN
jgi:uncharacterized protein (TIGR04222 family)